MWRVNILSVDAFPLCIQGFQSVKTSISRPTGYFLYAVYVERDLNPEFCIQLTGEIPESWILHTINDRETQTLNFANNWWERDLNPEFCIQLMRERPEPWVQIKLALIPYRNLDKLNFFISYNGFNFNQVVSSVQQESSQTRKKRISFRENRWSVIRDEAFVLQVISIELTFLE